MVTPTLAYRQVHSRISVKVQLLSNYKGKAVLLVNSMPAQIVQHFRNGGLCYVTMSLYTKYCIRKQKT